LTDIKEVGIYPG